MWLMGVFPIAFISAGSTATRHLTSTEAALAGTALGAIVGLLSPFITGRSTEGRDRRRVRTDLRIQRLNEFYAPLVVLLDQDGKIHARLRQGKPLEWHILDHVNEVLSDSVDLGLAKAVVEINTRMRGIIEGKAGFADGELPDSFAVFLLHQDMLSRAIAGEPYLRDLETVHHFPPRFEEDIRAGYRRLLGQIAQDLGT